MATIKHSSPVGARYSTYGSKNEEEQDDFILLFNDVISRLKKLKSDDESCKSILQTELAKLKPLTKQLIQNYFDPHLLKLSAHPNQAGKAKNCRGKLDKAFLVLKLKNVHTTSKNNSTDLRDFSPYVQEFLKQVLPVLQTIQSIKKSHTIPFNIVQSNSLLKKLLSFNLLATHKAFHSA